MRIVYHLGAHCTDEERLLRCLLKNRGALAKEGIIVPGPAKYRTLLRDTAMALKGQPADRDTQALVLDQIMSEDKADRLVLSWDNFIGYTRGAAKGKLYGAAGPRMHAYCQVFPGIETEFYLAIRNPATFLPSVFQKQRGLNQQEFLGEVDPLSLRWSDTIASLRESNPDVNVTVWCDEDTPLLWPEVLQAVSGHSESIVLEETEDLLGSIMSADGMQRMATYLEAHPPQSPAQRQRIVSAFLDKFALADKVEVELEFEGWTEGLIEEMSTAYDRDVSRIIAMDGVRFLAP